MADLNPPEIPRKTYRGSCHCGAVEFDVVHPDVETAGSICRRNGYLLIYTPSEDIKFVRGEDHLTGYKFNKKLVEHRFCQICGTSVMGCSQRGNAVNIRALHGIEPDKIKQYRYLEQKGGHRSDGGEDVNT